MCAFVFVIVIVIVHVLAVVVECVQVDICDVRGISMGMLVCLVAHFDRVYLFVFCTLACDVPAVICTRVSSYS